MNFHKAWRTCPGAPVSNSKNGACLRMTQLTDRLFHWKRRRGAGTVIGKVPPGNRVHVFRENCFSSSVVQ